MNSKHYLERIKEEFNDLNNRPIINLGITVGLPEKDNLFKWRLNQLGPNDTPYMEDCFIFI